MGDGFVIDRRQIRNGVARLGCGDDELGVIRPQMARDPAGGGGLVIKTFVKADGESLDRLCRLGLHHGDDQRGIDAARSEEHTSELQSLMRISYAVFCLKKKNKEYKEA